MNRRRGRRLWLRVRAHGGVIPVYVTKEPLLLENGTELDAYYDVSVPEIVVKAMDNVVLMKQKLHHELLHVCFGAHTGDARAKVLGGNSADREEAIVSFLEPVQFDMLVRNGFLRYPKPPKV